MKYIISKCKKCGATVQSFVELSQEATCPECGGHEFSKVKEEESLVKPVNYCPPSSTVETFMEVVARIAVERDMPEDCLQAIDPKRLCKYWVPSYYFQGTFDGQWKCQVKGGMKVSINNGKEIEIPDGAPLQGSAKNVPFSFLVPSVDLENAEPWVSEFPAISTDEKGESISSEAILQDASMLTLPFVPNALQQWSAIGNKVGDSVIEDYATEELQDSLTMYHALGILTDDEYALMHNSMNGKPLKMGTTEYKNWEVLGRFSDSYNNTVEYNITSKEFTNNNNSIENNEVIKIDNVITSGAIDSDYYNLEVLQSVMNTHGAFAGNDPYVISGVPAGPIITDMVVPATVEMGSKLNVTIKVDISR